MRGEFLDAKERLRVAKSTLSERSLAKNPWDHTKRLVKIYEAVWSLNRLRDTVTEPGELDQQVLTARERLCNAAAAITAGDLPLASQRVMDCAALIDQAEAQSQLMERTALTAEAINAIVEEEQDCHHNQAFVEHAGGCSTDQLKSAA